MRILCADVGGTKTRIALCEDDGVQVRIRAERDYPSAAYSGLEVPLEDFLALDHRPVEAACLAVAGPVQADCCTTTNLPWTVDAHALAARLGIPQIRLLNDLEAAAWGIGALGPNDLQGLQAGAADARGNASVIAAGTGLGEAGLFWDGQRHHPFASEGGHAEFAPSDEREFRLQQHLAAQLGRVSWEHLVSGPGIARIHAFLRDYRPPPPPPPASPAQQGCYPAAVLAPAAHQGPGTLCQEAIELFLRFYGREAGNQALKLLATGGVYLAGGIAPKLLGPLRGPAFLEGFRAKGPMEPLMRRIPVRVVLNDRIPLLGAALALTQGGPGDQIAR